MKIANIRAVGAWISVLTLLCAANAYAVTTSAPNAATTADLYLAGGTPGSFSTIRALDAMIGQAATTAEVKKLKAQYGGSAVNRFENVSDFVMNDAWMRAGKADVAFPSAIQLLGRDLAGGVLRAGTTDASTFEMPTFLDNAVTKDVHAQVMDDVAVKFGADESSQYYRIANQLFYDVAQTIGATSVKLAADH